MLDFRQFFRSTKKLGTGFIMLALALPLAIAGQSQARTLEEAKQSGKIVVGISGDNPPFGFVDTSGQQQGYDAEIARAFAKSLGLEVEFQQLSLAARIPSLGSQKIDILIAGLGMTKERAKSVQYTKPYLETKMYVTAAKETQITSADDLAKFTLGTPRSSTLDTLLTAAAPKGSNISRFDDDAATIQSLLSGQVDAIGANQFAIERLEKIKAGAYENKIQIGSVWYGAATRVGEKDWNEAFNTFIESYRPTPEFKTLYGTWLKNDVPSFPETLDGIPFVAK